MRRLWMKALLAGPLCVLAMSAGHVSLGARQTGCPPRQSGVDGWGKESSVNVDVSGLPESVAAYDAQGYPTTVDVRQLARDAMTELSSFLQGTNSKVSFSDNPSDAKVTFQNARATDPITNEDRPAVSTITTVQVGNTRRTTNQAIKIDLNTAGTVPNSFLSESGRPSGTPWFDPTGAHYLGDPAGDYSSYVKELIKHELLHGMGLGDVQGAQTPGATMMNGSYVPNDRKSTGDKLLPTGPTENCDKNLLNTIYPPSFEDDPDWWYGYCGVTAQDVFDCEHQSDYYWYDFPTCYCTLGASPIVINLDRSAFRFTSPADGVDFDLLATANPVRTAWIQAQSNDAFLVLDRNLNGLIDSGVELFGNVTPQPVPPLGVQRNGFLALSVFDSNGDGAITAADSVFNDLRLWRDRNHDGISQPGELATLSSESVTRIALNYSENRRRDRHGNMLRYWSLVELTAGTSTAIDVFFRVLR